MGWIVGFMAVPLTLFILFIVPVWLWMHYRKTPDSHIHFRDEQKLGELQHKVNTMRERIDVLEAILDTEYPNWRQNR